MTTLARGLQFIGLTLPLAGILLAEGGRGRANAMSVELGCLAAGAAIFYVGWRLQQRGA